MCAQVINKRPYRAFLSHAHVDKKKIVDDLYDWCADCAGIKLWYDSVALPASAMVPAELGKAIGDCQAAMIVLSESSLKSGWVQLEWNMCVSQQAEYPDFQVIPIRIDQSKPPNELGVNKWIDLIDGSLTPATATQLIETLHWAESDPKGIGRAQVYLARGSRRHEAEAAASIASWLDGLGFRAVRDAPDWKDMDESRIGAIIASCGGLVAIASDRGGGRTSSYILREISLAEQNKLPVLAIVEEGVRQEFADRPLVRVCEVPSLLAGLPASVEDAVADFIEEIRAPPRPAHCFLGHAFTKPEAEMWSCVQRCVQSISGMQCISGDQILGGDVQRQIVNRIREATYCIFDITPEEAAVPVGAAATDRGARWRLNSCIEAGIALGGEAKFELVCRGPRRSPPFMFRDRQVWFYDSPTELLGLIRKISLPFRRVVG